MNSVDSVEPDMPIASSILTQYKKTITACKIDAADQPIAKRITGIILATASSVKQTSSWAWSQFTHRSKSRV